MNDPLISTDFYHDTDTGEPVPFPRPSSPADGLHDGHTEVRTEQMDAAQIAQYGNVQRIWAKCEDLGIEPHIRARFVAMHLNGRTMAQILEQIDIHHDPAHFDRPQGEVGIEPNGETDADFIASLNTCAYCRRDVRQETDCHLCGTSVQPTRAEYNAAQQEIISLENTITRLYMGLLVLAFYAGLATFCAYGFWPRPKPVYEAARRNVGVEWSGERGGSGWRVKDAGEGVGE